jgi:transposase-like protein
MFVAPHGAPYLLWRAVDEHGVGFEILLQKWRDKAAAQRFFKRVLGSNPVPRKIVTDQLRSYPAALRTETTSVARFSLSQTTRSSVRRMGRIYQRHSSSVECFLSSSTFCTIIDEVPQVDGAPRQTNRISASG